MRRVLALLLGLGVLAGALAHFEMRESFEGMPPFVWQQLLLWCGLLVITLSFFVGRGRRGLGAPVSVLGWLAVGTPLVFALVSLVWVAPDEAGAPFASMGPPDAFLGCFAIGALLSAVLVVLGALAFRHAFPAAALLRGATLGAASGVAAAIVLMLHCGITAGGHVASAHGIPIALAVFAGSWGARLLRA